MNKVKENSLAVGLALMLVGILMQPVAAWGGITHLAITTELNDDPYDIPDQVTSCLGYTKGGGAGPDMFYYLPGKEYYSVLAHTQQTADLPREMLKLASTDQKKAYAYGWLSHYASDIKGHTGYVNIKVNNPPYPSHEKVEIGVDANVVDEVPDLTFNVPYGLVQTAYINIYGTAPGQITIFSAAIVQQTAFYIERTLILAGAFDNLKNTYNDFWSVYEDSISDSESAIIDPSDLPNVNLYTGESLNSTMAAHMPVLSNLNKAKHIDPDILDAANELLRKGAIEVPARDDKINEVHRCSLKLSMYPSISFY